MEEEKTKQQLFLQRPVSGSYISGLESWLLWWEEEIVFFFEGTSNYCVYCAPTGAKPSQRKG